MWVGGNIDIQRGVVELGPSDGSGYPSVIHTNMSNIIYFTKGIPEYLQINLVQGIHNLHIGRLY